MVAKRSGQRQPFDRVKVAAGIEAAAKNRPVTTVTIQALAADVEESLRLTGSEVSSEQVGVAVLERLRAIDEVAYLRFASVYKDFSAAGDFEREAGLLKSTAPKPPTDTGPPADREAPTGPDSTGPDPTGPDPAVTEVRRSL